MDPQQSTVPQTVVKKVLVKRVKVLVKRPVAAPQPAAPAVTAVPAPAKPTLVKVPVKRPVVQQPVRPATAQTVPQPPASVPPPQPAPAVRQAPPVEPPATPPSVPSFSAPASVQQPAGSKPKRKSFVGQVINNVEVKPLQYELPDDILEAVEKRDLVTDKLFLLYIYTRIYTQQVAREEGYAYPQMMIELPEDTLQAAQLFEEIDNDLFLAMLDDFVEMAPFVTGMERILANKAPLEQIIQSELKRVQNQETLSTAQQILIAYLTVLVDMQLIQEKLNMADIQNESDEIIDDIKEMEESEKEIKQSFITAIERKDFPVDARKLINNYFTLAKKDPDKAYETLITNPLFFSPIQMERLPKKFFGLIKPSPKDAMAVNKKLASFLKNLKV